VLASLGARLRFRLAADVTLASFLVSHITPFGSATGTLLNVSTLEAEGIAASTTGEAIGLTSLVSTVALIALFGTGLVATAGRHISATYIRIAGIALVLVVLVLGIALLVGAHPSIAERAARRAAGWAQHVRRSIDPEKVAQTSGRLVRLARSALTGRAFAESYGFASGDLLFDLLSLDLMFLAFRYQPGFALVWPGITVYALVFVFAVYAFIDAGLQAVRAFSSRTAGPAAGHLLFGLIDLAAGVIALVWPGPTALVLVLIVGIWAFVGGIFEIVAAFQRGETGGTCALFLLGGLVPIAFGVVLFARPTIGAVALALLFGLFSLIYGISQITTGVELRRTGKTLHSVMADAA
jgi:uncharacterized membrane protein HdeD (DUF308 family)